MSNLSIVINFVLCYYKMWNVRLSLLYSLSRYDEAEKELRAFKELDQPDLYYQYDKRQYPEAIGESSCKCEMLSYNDYCVTK